MLTKAPRLPFPALPLLGIVFIMGNLAEGGTETTTTVSPPQPEDNISATLSFDLNSHFISYSTPPITSNGWSVARALDEFTAGDAVDPALTEFIGDLGNQNVAYLYEVLAGLAAPAEAALDFSQSVVGGNHRIAARISDHLATARSQTGIASMPVGMSAAAPAAMNGSGRAWGSISYDRQDYDGGGGTEDFDGGTASIAAGSDYRLGPALVAGFLLDGSRTDIDDLKSFRGAMYGTWGAPTGLYSDFLIGFGTHENDFTDAASFQALATVGYAVGGPALKHGPYAGLEYQHVEVDGFTTGGFFPVDVDGFGIASLRALAGYRVDTDLGRFRPYASIAYAHECEDGGNSTGSSAGAASFRIEGGSLGSAILLTAGTGISLNRKLTLDAGYRGEMCVDNEGMDSQGGTLGLDWRF